MPKLIKIETSARRRREQGRLRLRRRHWRAGTSRRWSGSDRRGPSLSPAQV